jgi:hypothetical protein
MDRGRGCSGAVGDEVEVGKVRAARLRARRPVLAGGAAVADTAPPLEQHLPHHGRDATGLAPKTDRQKVRLLRPMPTLRVPINHPPMSRPGLPCRDQHLRIPAPAADERQGQRHRDPGVTAPVVGPAAPGREACVHRNRPRCPRRPAPPPCDRQVAARVRRCCGRVRSCPPRVGTPAGVVGQTGTRPPGTSRLELAVHQGDLPGGLPYAQGAEAVTGCMLRAPARAHPYGDRLHHHAGYHPGTGPGHGPVPVVSYRCNRV